MFLVCVDPDIKLTAEELASMPTAGIAWGDEIGARLAGGGSSRR